MLTLFSLCDNTKYQVSKKKLSFSYASMFHPSLDFYFSSRRTNATDYSSFRVVRK